MRCFELTKKEFLQENGLGKWPLSKAFRCNNLNLYRKMDKNDRLQQGIHKAV